MFTPKHILKVMAQSAWVTFLWEDSQTLQLSFSHFHQLLQKGGGNNTIQLCEPVVNYCCQWFVKVFFSQSVVFWQGCQPVQWDFCLCLNICVCFAEKITPRVFLGWVRSSEGVFFIVFSPVATPRITANSLYWRLSIILRSLADYSEFWNAIFKKLQRTISLSI